MPDSYLTAHPGKWANLLANLVPYFDSEFVRDIRPVETAIAHVGRGSVPPGTPPVVVQTRFRHVYPDTTVPWSEVPFAPLGCESYEPPENQIAFGVDQLVYGAVQQRWVSPIFDFRQINFTTHAREHIQQILSDVLKPAVVTLMNELARYAMFKYAGHKWAANRYMSPIDIKLVPASESDPRLIYLDINVDPDQLFLLTPAMLQRIFTALQLLGYCGTHPYSEARSYITLLTDMDTIWNLLHLCGTHITYGGANGTPVPSVGTNWRFENFTEASKFWEYGYSGQIGPALVAHDPTPWRFAYTGETVTYDGVTYYRLQRVLPYKNVYTSGAGSARGLGSTFNPDYLEDGLIQLSFIPHPRGVSLLSMKPVKPAGLQFDIRPYTGQWEVLTPDVIVLPDKSVVDNKFHDKCMLASWSIYWIRPEHPEFLGVIVHKVAKSKVIEIDVGTAEAKPQSYTSSINTGCPIPAEQQPETNPPWYQAEPPAGQVPGGLVGGGTAPESVGGAQESGGGS